MRQSQPDSLPVKLLLCAIMWGNPSGPILGLDGTIVFLRMRVNELVCDSVSMNVSTELMEIMSCLYSGNRNTMRQRKEESVCSVDGNVFYLRYFGFPY